MPDDETPDWRGTDVDFDADGCLIIKDAELARRIYAKCTGKLADKYLFKLELAGGIEPIPVPQGARPNECPKGDGCCPNFQCLCDGRYSHKQVGMPGS